MNRGKFWLSAAGFLAAIYLAAPLTAVAAIDPDDCDADLPYKGPARAGAVSEDFFPPNDLVWAPMPAENQDTLIRRFEEVLPLTEATAATVAILSDRGYWSHSVGTGGKSMWWASVAKLFTGALVLRLVESGQLSLEDPLSNWYPKYPGSQLITVNQLLTHTSGAFSFNADKKFRKKKGYTKPEDLLNIAARHQLDFCPGTDWYYSNTGYVLLALIAEKVSGQPLAKQVENLAQSLQLDSIRLVQPKDESDSVVPGFDGTGHTVKGIATSFGAGGVAGVAPDMLRFLHAYLSGDIVQGSTRNKAFADRYAMFGQLETYGRGVMVIPVPDPEFTTTWIGHTGGAPGTKAVLVYDVKRKTYIAIAINRQAAAEAVANALLKTLDGL